MSQGYLEESRRLTRKGRTAAFLQVATPALLGYRLGPVMSRCKAQTQSPRIPKIEKGVEKLTWMN